LEYENLDRLKKVRGFVLGLFGSFIFGFSSVVVTVRQQPSYLVVGLLSLSSIVLAYFSLKSRANLARLVFLLGASALLAAEASVVMIYFVRADAFVYAITTLIGGVLAGKGVMDMENLKTNEFYWHKKKETEKELVV